MTGESNLLLACWQQMLTSSFKDNPDERLKVYNSISNNNNNHQSSDMWKLMMLKAVQDPWSRIRKLGRENIILYLTNKDNKINEKHIQFLFSLIIYKWSQVQYWYEKEGLLLLFLDIFLQESIIISDISILSHILVNVVIPSLSDLQLPVRDSAVKVALCIIKINMELTSFLIDFIFSTLETIIIKSNQNDNIGQLDGFLNCFSKILAIQSNFFIIKLLNKSQPLLLKLAIHSAASIRQRVAEVWAIPSIDSFIILCKSIIEKVEKTLENDNEEWWRMVETLLIALQEQLTHYLSSSNVKLSLGHKERYFIVNSLYAALIFTESKQFEVSRMGRQILPLLIQFWVRFVSSPNLLKECCNNFFLKFRNCINFSNLFLPQLIWFLVLKSYLNENYNEEEVIKNIVIKEFLPFINEKLEILSNLNNEKNIFILPEFDCSLIILLIFTYFPNYCYIFGNKKIINYALSEEIWERVIKEDVNNIKYAIDFTLLIRQSGGKVMHLIPIWLNKFLNIYTHQQCLVLEALKIAISTKNNWELRKPFIFAYYSIFKAPTIQEGGEEIILGYFWLKQKFPLQISIPKMKSIPFKINNNLIIIPEIFYNIVYKQMYSSKVVDPSALNVVRSLMLLECEANPLKETISIIVKNIFNRLENIIPYWRNYLSNSSIIDNNLSNNVIQKNNNWDNSDSEEDVEGITPEEEIKETQNLFKIIINNHFLGNKEKFLKEVWPIDYKDGILLFSF